MKTLCLFSLIMVGRMAVAGPAEEMTDLARRGLPFVQEKGIAWMEDRECVSCHQVPAMLWSLRRATVAGLWSEAAKLAEWSEWSADWRHWNNESAKATEQSVVAGNVDTIAQLLLGRDPAASPEPAWVARFRDHLVQQQQPDGSWKAGGQHPLEKRPPREVAEAATMRAMLALRSCGAGESVTNAMRQAEGFLSSAAPGKSTEWHALRLLLEVKDPARREAVLKLQGPGGGWGWLAAEAGDALGTGFALHALARAGVPPDHESVQKAVAFLKTTQRPDGSWAVPSTRASDKGKVIPTSTYWGTAWAVIGLLEFPRPG